MIHGIYRKLSDILAKWRLALGVITITLTVGILLYHTSLPFRNLVSRLIPKETVADMIRDYTTIVLIAFLASLLGGKKIKKKITAENSERLGVTFREADKGYIGKYKDRKITYTFSDGNGDDDYAEFDLYHQRPLNLGVYLIITQSKFKLWWQTLRLFISQGLISNRIRLPAPLLEKGLSFWATDDNIGKQLILNPDLNLPLFQLDELVNQNNGHFVIDDTVITMRYPFKTILDSSILETALQVSTAFTSSMMLPQQISRRLKIWRGFWEAIFILIVIAIVANWAWSIIKTLL
jgi:hypothetical protein